MPGGVNLSQAMIFILSPVSVPVHPERLYFILADPGVSTRTTIFTGNTGLRRISLPTGVSTGEKTNKNVYGN